MRSSSVVIGCILASCLLYNCESQVENKNLTAAAQKPQEKVDSTQIKLKQLIALYPKRQLPLQLSTERIEGTPETLEKDSIAGGKPIPSYLLDLFPERLYSENGDDVFAIAKLSLPEGRIGLLTRVPSVYVSSKIKLFVLNSRTGHVEAECEVAETVGDAGASYTRTAEIHQSGKQELLVKIKQSNCWPLDEELSKFECTDSLFTYRVRGYELSLLSNKKVRHYRPFAS